MTFKIFFSNIGYAKGIDGSLWQHLCRAGRHLYCSIPLQQQILEQLRRLIHDNQPDVCCLVEVDRGSIHTAFYNQLDHLLADNHYPFHDISDKYGANNWLSRLPPRLGKSNAILSKKDLPFERLYFANGSKRLIYKVQVTPDVSLFSAHFSLNRAVRRLQMQELNKLVRACAGEVMIMADFNILHGFDELAPLLAGTTLRLINDADTHTFTFHRYRWTLDLCLCTEKLAARTKVHVVPQPFSDHAALLAEIAEPG